MKYSYKTIALFLGLGLVAASCQKENVVVESVSAEENQSYINARYTVDGVSMQISFSDEGSWQAFLHWLFALVEEGHSVIFEKDGLEYGIVKETVTFVTGSKTEAESWADKMVLDGYRVYVDFDEKTKTYTCVATR